MFHESLWDSSKYLKGIIQNGLNTAVVDPYWQLIVFGAFTIFAVPQFGERRPESHCQVGPVTA